MTERESLKELFAESARKVKRIKWGEEVGVWYDNAGHYCDVVWSSLNDYCTDTERPEVMAMVDHAHNLLGFKIDAVKWMGDGAGGYTTVNLRSRLQPAAATPDAGGAPGMGGLPWEGASASSADAGVIVPGVIRARYDHSVHSFEVLWADGETQLTATENPHILAAADAAGRLCGFRVIHIDRLSDDEYGLAHTRLPLRLAASAAR